jgi:hypothetical protein
MGGLFYFKLGTEFQNLRKRNSSPIRIGRPMLIIGGATEGRESDSSFRL